MQTYLIHSVSNGDNSKYGCRVSGPFLNPDRAEQAAIAALSGRFTVGVSIATRAELEAIAAGSPAQEAARAAAQAVGITGKRFDPAEAGAAAALKDEFSAFLQEQADTLDAILAGDRGGDPPPTPENSARMPAWWVSACSEIMAIIANLRNRADSYQ